MCSRSQPKVREYRHYLAMPSATGAACRAVRLLPGFFLFEKLFYKTIHWDSVRKNGTKNCDWFGRSSKSLSENLLCESKKKSVLKKKCAVTSLCKGITQLAYMSSKKALDWPKVKNILKCTYLPNLGIKDCLTSYYRPKLDMST